jgi:hypothetical protein
VVNHLKLAPFPGAMLDFVSVNKKHTSQQFLGQLKAIEKIKK